MLPVSGQRWFHKLTVLRKVDCGADLQGCRPPYAMQQPPAPGHPSGPPQRSGASQPNCALPEENFAIFDFEISLFRFVLPQPVQVSPFVLSRPATICSHVWPHSAH